MFSKRYSKRVQNLLAERTEVRLAVFGPGIGRPYFEKRRVAYEAIKKRLPANSGSL